MGDAEWVMKLMAAVRPHLPKEFIGQIEINIFKGNITNVNVRQSFKDETISR